MTKIGSFAFGGDQRSYSFPRFHADLIPNSTEAVACPSMPCEQVYIQNSPDSSGNIRIGGAGTPFATGGGFTLVPGQVFGWIPLQNLNLIWHIDAADSNLEYTIIW